MSDRLLRLQAALAAAPERWALLKANPNDMIAAIDMIVRRLMKARGEIVAQMQQSRKAPIKGFLAQRDEERVGQQTGADEAKIAMPAVSSKVEEEGGQLESGHVPTNAMPPSSSLNGTDAGQHQHADEAIETLPASVPPSREAGGQNLAAQLGQARRAFPTRPLSVEQRRANIRVAEQYTQTLLDLFRVRDGRSVGDVCWSEIPALIDKDEHSAAVLRGVYQSCVPDNPNARVRDVVSVRQLDTIIKAAKDSKHVRAA